MKKRLKLFAISILAVFALNIGCAELEVENQMSPDTERVLSTPEDLLGLAGGAMRTWFMRITATSSPGLAMATAADHLSCSWGNFGMKETSSEPRPAWNNSVTYSYAYVNRDCWNSLYSSLSAVTDVLMMIEDGAQIGEDGEDNDMTKAWCYLMQGLNLGYLGLIFDKAKIVDEEADLGALEYSTWREVVDAAIVKLDKCITACSATFTLPSGWIIGLNSFTNDDLKKLANSFAARFLAYAPRNATQAASQIPWATVKSYIQAGITEDWMPVMDDVTWWHNVITYGVYPGWVQVDMRTINLMAPIQPDYYPLSGQSSDLPNDGQVLAGESLDARMYSDFEYKGSCPFKPERGYYHYTHYRMSRYDTYISTWTEPLPGMLLWEMKTLLALAEMEIGTKAAAIAILNDAAGARKVRGELADIPGSATDAEVIEAIYYERSIECLLSSPGMHFYDMRRRDYLQPGTMLHWPVSAKELETLGEENYTFGGNQGVEGEDYAAATSGWPVQDKPGGWK